MKQKVYWKDLCHSFTSSKGRFLSILTLMMLGTLALVGLKVTTPNMHRTAQRFIDQQEMLDLAVMGDLGLDKTDQEELQGLTGASLEFSYLTDVTIDGKDEAVRLFSTPETISRFQLAAGRLPQKEDEVALAAFWKDRYQIGDQLRIHEKAGSPSVLKTKNYRIVGFVKSAEMWSEKDLGQATSGSGSLDAYGILSKEAFTSPVYSLARIRFDDLRGLNPFSTSYQDRLASHQKELEKLLARNGQERYRKLQADGKQKIQKGQEELDGANKQLAEAREKAGQAQTQLTEQSNKLNQLSTLLPKEELETRRLELAEAQKQLDQQLVNIQTGESELATKQKDLEKTKEELENKIATFTGGRAAEELIFHSITTGASNDIEQATKIARGMISRYGMSDEFDMVAMESMSNQYLGGDSSLSCSFETQTLLDKKVVELVRRQHEKAYKILEDNIDKLHELAKYLYEHETITGEEFMKILNDPPKSLTASAE